MTRRIALHLLLIALAAVAVLPFIWLVCAAFKSPDDLLEQHAAALGTSGSSDAE